MAGAASEAGTCSERDAADGVAGCAKGRSRCGAALALVPPLCATARPLCAARPDRAASLPLPTDTPPCAAVWRKRENRRPQNVQVNRGAKKVQDKSGWSLSRPPAVHPAPQRGSGTGTRWSVWPPVGRDRWSEMIITEEKPPGFSLSQGGCAGWFLRKMEEFDYEKKTGSFSGTGRPR